MPMKRKFRKRRFKRRPNFKKKVLKIINNAAEKKYTDVSTSISSLVGASPLIAVLNDLTVGTNFAQRIGNKVSLKTIVCNIRIRNILPTTMNASSVRVYVIQSLSDLDPIQLPTTVFDHMPPLNASLTLYKVLFDRHYDMSTGVNGAKNFTIKLRPPRALSHVNWSGANITLGTITCHIITDNAVPLALSANIESRFYFTDI